jgi:hypothetical protein
VDNAERAITHACLKTDAEIKEYTAGPVFMSDSEHGAHEWLVEFSKEPADFNRFAFILDEHLREINSDYDAKRYNNLILDPPIIQKVKEGIFDQWLKNKGKLGGQNKVPRLSNDRKILDEIQHVIFTENSLLKNDESSN